MKVIITRKIPESGIAYLKKFGFSVEVRKSDVPPTQEELIALSQKADAMITLLTDPLNETFFKNCGKKLQIVANYAVGFDNISAIHAQERKIAATNTPVMEMSQAVAEHAWGLILSIARRIVESDTFTRGLQYKTWGPELLLGMQLKGKTLCIVGSGRIGSEVARIGAHGFGMKIVYVNPHKNDELEKTVHAKRMTLERALKIADVVSIHTPLTPETRHLISKKEFALMKKTAVLINTARGPIVDEKALLQALSKKQIGGAALDVFECEPALDCDVKDHLELRKMPNVILTPHTASATIEAREAMSLCAAKNVVAVLKGKKPLNSIY